MNRHATHRTLRTTAAAAATFCVLLVCLSAATTASAAQRARQPTPSPTPSPAVITARPPRTVPAQRPTSSPTPTPVPTPSSRRPIPIERRTPTPPVEQRTPPVEQQTPPFERRTPPVERRTPPVVVATPGPKSPIIVGKPRGAPTSVMLSVVKNPAPVVDDHTTTESYAYTDAQYQEPVTFSVMTENAAHSEFVLEYSFQPHNGWPFPEGGTPKGPCDDWQKLAKNKFLLPATAELSALQINNRHYGTITRRALPPGIVKGNAPFSVVVRAVPVRSNKMIAVDSPIPASATPECVGKPSNWVKFRVLGTLAEAQVQVPLQKQKAAKQKQADEEFVTNAEISEAQSLYDVSVVGYVPPKFIRDEGAERHLKVSQNLDVSFGTWAGNWNKGCTYDAKTASFLLKKDPGVFQELHDIATGTINMASEGYESAKGWAVGSVAGAIPDPPGCGTQCQSNLKTGLEFALAYAGIPPSLPNTRQLYAQGADYLAASLAEYAVKSTVGVDAGIISDAAYEAAYKASEKGISKMVSALGCATPGEFGCGIQAKKPYSWGFPDPTFHPHPGVLYVKITAKPGASQHARRMTGMMVIFDGMFGASGALKIPYVPAKGMIIPVTLWPRINGKTVQQFPVPYGDEGYAEFEAYRKSFGTYNASENGDGTYWYSNNGSVKVRIDTFHGINASNTWSVPVTWEDTITLGSLKGTYGRPKRDWCSLP